MAWAMFSVTSTKQSVTLYAKHRCISGAPIRDNSVPEGISVYQLDSAPNLTSRIVKMWFLYHSCDFQVTTWYPNSPDMKLVEHLLLQMGSQIRVDTICNALEMCQNTRISCLVFPIKYHRQTNSNFSNKSHTSYCRC